MPSLRPLPRTVSWLVLPSLLLVACGDDPTGKELADPVFPPPATQPPPTSAPVATTAPAPLQLLTPWVDGAALPDRATCLGEGISPAMSWASVPAGTVELAVTVVDADNDRFVHWIVYGMSPIENTITEGSIPTAAFEWPNSEGDPEYLPPCAPEGDTHRYEFTVHALNQQLEVADDASAAEVLSFLNATTIARSTVLGVVTGLP